MPDVGLVLKVPQETHAKLKRACVKNDRSMQKVVLALIEGWIACGSPDPSNFGKSPEGEEGIDRVARMGLGRLANEVELLIKRVDEIEENANRKSASREVLRDLARLVSEEISLDAEVGTE